MNQSDILANKGISWPPGLSLPIVVVSLLLWFIGHLSAKVNGFESEIGRTDHYLSSFPD